MKKFIFFISLAGFTSFFTACSSGYVAEEPTYVVVSRPQQPNPTYVWVGDDWTWNRQTKVYVRREGNWVAPNRGRTYAPGYWRKTNRGNQWVSGRWR
jgi:hypothetical protein